MKPSLPNMSGLTLSILVPVRNEGVNLPIMMKILKAVVEVPYEVLVVHDRTDDDSIGVVQTLENDHPTLRRICNTKGDGVPNAIRSGMEVARGKYVMLFAADDVGPALVIKEMLQLMDQGCDLVSCTRYAQGGQRLGGSLIGGILSRMANWLFRLLTGTFFTDCTAGVKMFRRSIFDRLQLEAGPVGWAVAFEMAIKAQYLGLKLSEVGVISIDRPYGGKSTFQLKLWWREYARWFWWGVRHLHRWNKAKPQMLAQPQGEKNRGQSFTEDKHKPTMALEKISQDIGSKANLPEVRMMTSSGFYRAESEMETQP